MLLLLVLAAGLFAPFPTYASGTTSETIYFHVDPSSSYTVGTINTGGVIFNSTTLGLSSSGNTKSGSSGSYSQTWYLSQLMAGSATVSGTPTMKLDLYASAASNWNYTIQIIQATSSGSTVGVLSQAHCSGATGCLSLTTSQALYTISGFSAISSTTLSANQVLEVSLIINESATNTVNFVVENNNPSLTSYFTIPLSSPAVTINSETLSSSAVAGSGSTTATLSVSDAFGLYDLASQTITATIAGSSVSPINAQAMTASSSNTPTSYTGTYTYVITPSSTSYSTYVGVWNVQSTITDNSGNSYSSAAPQFTYSTGGCYNCIQSSSTSASTAPITNPSQGHTGGQGSTVLVHYIEFGIVAAAIVLIAVVIVKKVE